MNSQLVSFALWHRENKREPKYFTSQDLSGIRERLGGTPNGPVATASRMRSGRRRGAGGVTQQGGVQQLGGTSKRYSDKLMNQFKVDTDVKGNPIVLRQTVRMEDVSGAAGTCYLPVVALEDLPALIAKHQAGALGYGGIKAVFNHVRGRVGGEMAVGKGGLCSAAGLAARSSRPLLPPTLPPPTRSPLSLMPHPLHSCATMPARACQQAPTGRHASCTAWRALRRRASSPTSRNAPCAQTSARPSLRSSLCRTPSSLTGCTSSARWERGGGAGEGRRGLPLPRSWPG